MCRCLRGEGRVVGGCKVGVYLLVSLAACSYVIGVRVGVGASLRLVLITLGAYGDLMVTRVVFWVLSHD